jgi:PH domain
MGWRWRTRWIVLNDGMLFIGKHQNDQTGVSIPLFRSQLREHHPERFPNCFEVEAYNREAVVLGAENEMEMHEWLNVILKQKLMIEESVHSILL